MNRLLWSSISNRFGTHNRKYKVSNPGLFPCIELTSQVKTDAYFSRNHLQ